MKVRFSTNKFHPVCFELSVALQATLVEGVDIKPLSAEHSYPDLIHRGLFGDFVRVYFPANISGSLDEVRQTVQFLPWINIDDVIGYELLFRTRPFSKKYDVRRKLAFARDGEEKAFFFKKDRGVAYLDLDFLTPKVSEFRTLYMASQSNPYNEDSLKYFKFEASFTEGKMFVSTIVVDKGSTPVHLQSFR